MSEHLLSLGIMACAFIGGAAIAVAAVCLLSEAVHRRGRIHIPKSDN